MTGKEFEACVVRTNDLYRERHIADVGRYGVQAARRADDWVVMQSLPDFEGQVVSPSRQVVFDAKVCGSASFALHKYHPDTGGSKSRQFSHLWRRSTYGAQCGFLIHWTARELKTKSEPAITYWVPVDRSVPLWHEFLSFERKSINRDDCEHYGRQVAWVVPEGCRTERVDYLGVLDSVASTNSSISFLDFIQEKG